MHDDARREITAAARRLVTTAGGRLVRRPVLRDDPVFGTREEPEPLAGMTAAVALKHAAVQAISDFAKAAREDGISWEELGVALGCEADPATGTTVGEAGFRAVAAGRGPWDHKVFYWRCWACGQHITDYGPEAGHPTDTEEGHAGGCKRLAAEVAAWTARWGDQ